MIQGLILIEGKDVKEQDLQISLSNAKHFVVGNNYEFGFIIHIRATQQDDLNKALLDFSSIENVTEVIPLVLKRDQ